MATSVQTSMIPSPLDYVGRFMNYLEQDCPYVSEMVQYVNKDLDPRTGNWFLISSPLYPLIIALSYLLTIAFGKKYFKKHTWDADKILMFLENYNAFLVILNATLGCMFSYFIFKANYSFSCQPVSRVTSGDELRIAQIVYCFWLSKIVELMDTCFHVARKRNEMLTFLHLYHHSSMVVATWIGVRYVPGGSVAIIGMINSWVHVLMYIYYHLCAGGNRAVINRFMNYKKFVTLMQITQFCFTIGVCCAVLSKDCGFPGWVAVALAFYMLGFIVLFINFVIRMYL